MAGRCGSAGNPGYSGAQLDYAVAGCSRKNVVAAHAPPAVACSARIAPFFYFTALKELPLADATVIFFSATFILTAASALFFKEQVGVHRRSAVVIGFVGVIVAMNPQGGGNLGA